MSHLLPPRILRRRHAQTNRDMASNHKIEYVTQVQDILNLKGQQNCMIGSKVTAFLLNRWILPIGGVALGRVCNQQGLPRLVYYLFIIYLSCFVHGQ